MDPLRRYQLANVGLFLAAFVHGLLTWSWRPTVAVFLGGFLVALAAELIGVGSGLVEHNLRPQFAGVPLSILLAWPAVVYVCYRIALLVAPADLEAAALAAAIATAVDAATDPDGVRNGVWSYPESSVSSPRFRGVPWWNFVAWFVIVFLTALLAGLVR